MNTTITLPRVVDLCKYPEQGRKIYTRMAELNLSQVLLSNNTGISQSQISNFINGKYTPSLKTSKRLAFALKISLDEFASFFE